MQFKIQLIELFWPVLSTTTHGNNDGNGTTRSTWKSHLSGEIQLPTCRDNKLSLKAFNQDGNSHEEYQEITRRAI